MSFRVKELVVHAKDDGGAKDELWTCEGSWPREPEDPEPPEAKAELLQQLRQTLAAG